MQDEENNQKEENGSGEDAHEKCTRERDEYLAGWQRAKADFANYRKDEARRFEEIARYANEAFLEDCISVMDSFDLAILTHRGDPHEIKGLEIIQSQLADVLRKRGLERIGAKVDEHADPVITEAIGETESTSPPGTITEVVSAGYRLYGKIIRPVRVKISKGQTQK